jgi:hypothetical protein
MMMVPSSMDGWSGQQPTNAYPTQSQQLNSSMINQLSSAQLSSDQPYLYQENGAQTAR